MKIKAQRFQTALPPTVSHSFRKVLEGSVSCHHHQNGWPDLLRPPFLLPAGGFDRRRNQPRKPKQRQNLSSFPPSSNSARTHLQHHHEHRSFHRRAATQAKEKLFGSFPPNLQLHLVSHPSGELDQKQTASTGPSHMNRAGSILPVMFHLLHTSEKSDGPNSAAVIRSQEPPFISLINEVRRGTR